MSITAAKAPKPLPQDVQDLLLSINANVRRGFNPAPNTYEIYTGRIGCQYVSFQAQQTVADTLQSAMRAMFDGGITAGEVIGRRDLQYRLRNALGLDECCTDGHSRTVVIED